MGFDCHFHSIHYQCFTIIISYINCVLNLFVFIISNLKTENQFKLHVIAFYQYKNKNIIQVCKTS